MARNFLKERSSFLNMQGSYRPTLLAIYYLFIIYYLLFIIYYLLFIIYYLLFIIYYIHLGPIYLRNFIFYFNI